MFFLGMCILILFLLVLFRQEIYKQAIMLLLCSVLLFVLRKTDVSWVSSLPFFLVASSFFLIAEMEFDPIIGLPKRA